MEPVIRTLAPSESESYIALLKQVDEETPYLLYEPGERHLDAEALRQRTVGADPTKLITFVAEQNGELVGFLVSRRDGPNRVQHRASFAAAVLRKAWGQGIGSELLATLESWATAQQIQRLEMSAMANNHRAIELYKRAGFQIEGTKVAGYCVDGQPIDEIVMGKLLDPISESNPGE